MKDEKLIILLSNPEVKKLRALGYLDEKKIRASLIRLKYKYQKESNRTIRNIIEQLGNENNIGIEKVKDIIYRNKN